MDSEEGRLIASMLSVIHVAVATPRSKGLSLPSSICRRAMPSPRGTAQCLQCLPPLNTQNAHWARCLYDARTTPGGRQTTLTGAAVLDGSGCIANAAGDANFAVDAIEILLLSVAVTSGLGTTVAAILLLLCILECECTTVPALLAAPLCEGVTFLIPRKNDFLGFKRPIYKLFLIDKWRVLSNRKFTE